MVPGSGYEVLWATGVDLAGLVGNYYFKVECSDVDIGVSDSVLIQIDNHGVPRVGILKTFAGEYRDSVRFDYRVLDTNFALIEVDSSVLSYSGIFADVYYKFGIRAISLKTILGLLFPSSG